MKDIFVKINNMERDLKALDETPVRLCTGGLPSDLIYVLFGGSIEYVVFRYIPDNLFSAFQADGYLDMHYSNRKDFSDYSDVSPNELVIFNDVYDFINTVNSVDDCQYDDICDSDLASLL